MKGIIIPIMSFIRKTAAIKCVTLLGKYTEFEGLDGERGPARGERIETGELGILGISRTGNTRRGRAENLTNVLWPPTRRRPAYRTRAHPSFIRRRLVTHVRPVFLVAVDFLFDRRSTAAGMVTALAREIPRLLHYRSSP